MDLLGGWRDLFDLGDQVTAGSPDDVAAVIREQIASMGLLEEGQVDRIMASFAKSAEIAQAYQPGAYRGAVQVFTATADRTTHAGRVCKRLASVRGRPDRQRRRRHTSSGHGRHRVALRIIGPAVQRGLEAATNRPTCADALTERTEPSAPDPLAQTRIRRI